MPYQYGYVDAFLDGIWNNGANNLTPTSSLQNFRINTPHLSISNKQDVKWAVLAAFSTIFKSLLSRGINDGILLAQLDRNGAFDTWSDHIQNYMIYGIPSLYANYNAWHDYLCNDIVLALQNATQSMIIKKPVHYGMAQKIVNMTVKHLYCFDDAPQYYQRFNDCHMAIDSKILKWFYDKVVPWYRRLNPNTLSTSLKNNNFWKNWTSGIKTTPWSKLDAAEYKDIITLIREYFNVNYPSCNDTILEAEFVIWYEAKKNMETAKKAKKNNLPYTPQWTY